MLSGISSSTPFASQTAAAKGTRSPAEDSSGSTVKETKELSEDEQAQVQKLAETDRKVRAHESAHMAAAAGIAIGGASFGYESGPDGKRYAVSGEVQISVSEGKTPEETIARAEQVRRAALAPADPSAQDQKVAAEASQMAARARMAQVMASIQSDDAGTSRTGSLIDTEA